MSREALIVGINIYECAKDLQASVKDAEAIASHLQQSGDFRVKSFYNWIKERALAKRGSSKRNPSGFVPHSRAR